MEKRFTKLFLVFALALGIGLPSVSFTKPITFTKKSISVNKPADSVLADVASAATLPVLAPGYMDVTGTTTITSIADIGIGSVIHLRFSTALTLTHSANLILSSSNSLVTSTGDVFTFVQTTATVWRMISTAYPKNKVQANVASAAALPVLASGYMDVTGTTTITSIADIGIGSKIILQFDDSLTLTHHATNLILGPEAKDITTVVGDIYVFEQYAVGNWTLIGGNQTTGLSVGQTVQAVHATDAVTATGTTVMVLDDTIPQNTEGDEYMTASITPTNTNNKLLITFLGNFSHTASTTGFFLALFQDSTANALAVSEWARPGSGNNPNTVSLRHEMVAGTTSSITFKIRAGSNAAGTTTFNGTAGARKFGGVLISTFRITEIKV